MSATETAAARPDLDPAVPTDFMRFGACARVDPETKDAFFAVEPELTVKKARNRGRPEAELAELAEDWEAYEDAVSRAKSVCVACPVARQCGEYAIETREAHGIWGGMTVRERANVGHRAKKQRWRQKRADAGLKVV